MNRLQIETRGICNWRERLAKPDTQWRRSYSALETAVSWEAASRHASVLPPPIADLFRASIFGEARILLAIAEHKVPIAGGRADSQCDLWALLNTSNGGISLFVEAKANEAFGEQNQPLEAWLAAGESDRSRRNRRERWEHISRYLPKTQTSPYLQEPYQLLHRSAAAVIEAERFGLSNAAFVVQAFDSPTESFEAFSKFSGAFDSNAVRGQIYVSSVRKIRLGIGWADCPFASDGDIASIA